MAGERTGIEREVQRHKEDTRAVWELDRIEDALDAYTLARVYEDAFGDRWLDTGEPGEKGWMYAMSVYGLARLIIEHCWGVRVRLVWGRIHDTYLDEGRQEGMREFCEAIEGGYFDEAKRELIENLSREKVGEMVAAKKRALGIHDAVWKTVEDALLAEVERRA